MALAPSLESTVEHLLALSEGLYEMKAEFVRERKLPWFSSVYEKSEPLVSICVATCNRPGHLVDRCLASLLRQTYRNLQIIVVGDHCTDQTEYQISKIQDCRVTFENLPERGPYPPFGHARWFVAGSAPMNRALALCEGDFIAHLDDDDEATPDRIERLVAKTRETRAEFLTHQFFYQHPNGIWKVLGALEPVLGQVTTGSIFYHRYFARIPWDVFAFRLDEPGDWNRIRKIKFLSPRIAFVDEPLTIHYREQVAQDEVAQANERFLEF